MASSSSDLTMASSVLAPAADPSIGQPSIGSLNSDISEVHKAAPPHTAHPGQEPSLALGFASLDGLAAETTRSVGLTGTAPRAVDVDAGSLSGTLPPIRAEANAKLRQCLALLAEDPLTPRSQSELPQAGSTSCELTADRAKPKKRDGRVRIRCPCGGQRGDKQLRMHANWKELPQDNNSTEASDNNSDANGSQGQSNEAAQEFTSERVASARPAKRVCTSRLAGDAEAHLETILESLIASKKLFISPQVSPLLGPSAVC